MMEILGVGILLTIQAYWDIRCRRLPLVITVIGGACGLLCSLLGGRAPIGIVLGLIPGIVALLIGKVTREAIGYGDGLLLCAMGTYLSCSQLLSVCMVACTLAGIIALGMLVIGRKSGKSELPFVPFLWLGYGIYLIGV